MNNLNKIIKYIVVEYPFKSELSASRLTKIIYLADWKSAIDSGEQLTPIIWRFNHFGPYVEDVIECVREDPDMAITLEETYYGNKKTLIRLNGSLIKSDLSLKIQHLLNFVIMATKDKNYSDFIKLVYSTYPVITSDKYSTLNLVQLAEDYKNTCIG